MLKWLIFVKKNFIFMVVMKSILCNNLFLTKIISETYLWFTDFEPATGTTDIDLAEPVTSAHQSAPRIVSTATCAAAAQLLGEAQQQPGPASQRRSNYQDQAADYQPSGINICLQYADCSEIKAS